MSRPGKAPGVAGPNPGAAYASRPGESRGRRHDEPPSPTRSDFQRDRDRIIHSAAFRRLQHKTQVFVHHEGDHYRSRLTHSLEVAQIARSVARVLGLEEDLAEALALAHDLGHPPFGHAGEDALNAEMADHGGFDHNAQALRVLTRLERRYADFDGLNLTWEALEGIAKHNGPLIGEGKPPIPVAVAEYNADHDLELDTFAGPEAQVAALADDIAYNNHDIDDGVRAGLLVIDALAEVPLVGPVLREVRDRYPDLERPRLIHETVRRLIDHMVGDLLAETGRRVARAQPNSAAEVRALGRPLVAFSADLQADERVLRTFLMENMYRHERVSRMADEGRAMVGALFRYFMEQPAKLPDDWRPPSSEAGDAGRLARRVADFVAGMTDRYAIEAHRKLPQET